MIGDGEYCLEEEAIDVVVYDKNVGMVVDSVGVMKDTEKSIHF